MSRASTRAGLRAEAASTEPRVLDHLRGLTEGHRLRLVLIVVVSFLGGLAEALVLLLLARVAFALAKASGTVGLSLGPLSNTDVSMGALIAAAGVLVLFRFGLLVTAAWEQATLASGVLMDVRTRMVSDYMSASWAEQSADRDGRLQEFASGFATSASGQVIALTSFLAAICSLVAMLLTALFANFIGTFVIAVAAVGLIAVMRPFRAALRRRSRDNAAMNVQFATAVSEAASMIQEVHVFGVADAIREQLTSLADLARRSAERLQRLAGLLPAVAQSLALLVVVGAIGLVYTLGSTRLASLGAVVLIGVRALSYGQGVQAAYQQLHQGAPYMQMLREEHERYASSAPARGEERLDRIDELGADEVVYSYDGSGRFALASLSFTAARGQVIGIVGPSGAGKSTLVQLLLRLRDPTGGRMLANGVDIREYTEDDWTRLVSFVPQEAHLFSGTVAENIRFFRQDASDEIIERAARRAHLHDEIMAWPEGYATPVGERGRKLSGGQQQRLTIARGLVGDPDIVVLDEPTSNLDVRSEAAIRATLVELSNEALVFVIAHRLSTLDICDRIMVIQDGELRGFDEPKRLEASSEFYREALRLSGLR